MLNLNLNLKKKMVLQIVFICTFLVAISIISSYLEKRVASSYRNISSNQFPKVESVARLIANFRLIRIKVRSLGLMGNTDENQQKYINETKLAVKSFITESKAFHSLDFAENEKAYVEKMDTTWKEFLSFGLELLSKYENPTEKNLSEGGDMIRNICPIKASAWMNVAQEFLAFQKEKTKAQVLESMTTEKSIEIYTLLSLSISFIVAIGIGIVFSNKISKNILKISSSLRENTIEVRSSSSSVSSNSDQISESAKRSSESLQRTRVAMNEMNAMIKENAESASQSAVISEKSNKAVIKGKKTVEEMIHSVMDISKASEQIEMEMYRSNDEISKITEVIKDISEKTNIINDIVFQTKLLSFNASVEAARAGEQGKGFAVVAEEVGNLATMSGAAASEISELLERSTIEVDKIVKTTKANVENLTKLSKEKIEVGNSTAHNCGRVLDEILENAKVVNEMIQKIESVSKNQSEGVKLVTKSLDGLSESTQQNTLTSQRSQSTAMMLNNQARNLDYAVIELEKVVNGRSNNLNSENEESNVVKLERDLKKIAS